MMGTTDMLPNKGGVKEKRCHLICLKFQYFSIYSYIDHSTKYSILLVKYWQ